MIPLAGGLGRSADLTNVGAPENALLFADLDQGATPSSRGVAGHNFRSARRRGRLRHPRAVRRGECGAHDNDQLAHRKRHVAPVCDIGHIGDIGNVAPANVDHDDPVDNNYGGYELLVCHHTALDDRCADHLGRAQCYEHLPAGGTAGHPASRAHELYERSHDNDGQHLDDLYNGADYRFIDGDHGRPRHDHFHRAGGANYVEQADHLDDADRLDDADHVDDGPRSCWDLEPSAVCNGSLDGNLDADV
jgi:hypothetical protein